MIVFLAIIIIVVLIVIDEKESKTQRKIDNEIVGYNTTNGRPILRKYVNITGHDPRTGLPLFEYKKPIIGYNPLTGDPIFEGEEIPDVSPIKEKSTPEDKTRISNTILMIAGAALVVIASIIFLATGWDTMHGLLKTLILVGIQMIFYLFGYISNNKLNIPKIGKMFSYLTLAFVPIVLLSLSFFELVGDYFSIDCEGFNYYVAISFILSDIVYKLYGSKHNDTFVKRTSLIVEAISILCLTINIEIEYFVALALIIHTIIIYILLQGGYLDKEAYSPVNNFYAIFLTIGIALPSLDEVSIMTFTNLMLLALNFFLRCLDESENGNKKLYLIMFFIAYLLSIRVIENIDITPYFLYLLSLIPILGLIKVVSSNTMKKNVGSVVGILTVALTVFAIFDAEQTAFYVLTFITGFIISIILYLISKKSFYKLWAYISFSSIFFSICYVMNLTETVKYILLIMSILVYALEVIYDNLKDKTSSLFIIGALCIEVLFLTGTYYMLIPIALLATYTVLEKKDKEQIVPMIASLLLVSLDNHGLVSLMLVLLIIFYIYKSITNNGFNKFSTFSLINIFLLCIYNETTAYVLWSALLTWGIVQYLYKDTEDKEVYLTAIVFSLFGIYVKALIDIDSTLYANVALGIIISSVAMTKGILKRVEKEFLNFAECFVIGALTIVGSIAIQEPMDGVVYLGILLVLSIFSYIKEWKCYLYSSIVSMIFGVIVLTAEYWQQLPWYVYILVIGLALILFAMYDEKRKQTKKVQQEVPVVNIENIVAEDNQVTEELPVKEETILPQLEIVEDTSDKKTILENSVNKRNNSNKKNSKKTKTDVKK